MVSPGRYCLRGAIYRLSDIRPILTLNLDRFQGGRSYPAANVQSGPTIGGRALGVGPPDDTLTRGLTDCAATKGLYYARRDPSGSHHLLPAYDPIRDQTRVMAVLVNPDFQAIVRRGARWTAGYLDGR